MPIISKEDKEFLEYVAYKLNEMLFASAASDSDKESSHGKVFDFIEYSKKIGHKIKPVDTNYNGTPSPRLAKNAALQLNKEKEIKVEKSFTKQEIKEMPRLKDFTIRLKKDKYYEIRFRRYGYNMSFSSADFLEAKRKAFAWLETIEDQIKPDVHFTVLSKRESERYNAGQNVNFKKFADSFMFGVKAKRVKPETFKAYRKNYAKHVEPFFGKMMLRDIKPFLIQKHLDTLNEKIPRACEDVKMILNNVFDYAVANGVIERNPMKAVYLPKHEREHGKALTLSEERKFVQDIKGDKYENYFLKMLYSGVRLCEVRNITENLEENTLTIKNGKLKSYQKNYYRVVPIFPKYKQTLSMPLDKAVSNHRLQDVIKKYLPNHTLKDLRHTFTTRARECGIDNEVVAVWTGHSLSNITASVYTHFSIEFQQEQAKKLDYD